MKKKYLLYIFILGLVIFSEKGFSQISLTDSKFGPQIKEYIGSKREKYNLTTNDISDLYVNKEIFSKHNNSTQVYVNQRFNGIKIYNAISSISIKDNIEIYYANRFINNISKKVNTTIPLINPREAIENVVAHFNLGSIIDLNLLDSSNNRYVFSKSNISQENIPVELVYFKGSDDSLKLSWDLNIYTIDSKHWWSLRVDATNGAILDVNDWIISCDFVGNYKNNSSFKGDVLHTNDSFTLFKSVSLVADGSQYNVYPIPVESPNHGGRQLLFDPSDNLASPYGWHDDDGLAGAEYTITRGNNVIAQMDDDGNNGTGYSPDGTAALNFDFLLDFNQQPIGYKDVAVTNLFYWNNIMHDILYHYGFDPESGNFQEKHYIRVNVPGTGDLVLADAQDGSGLDNANFGTPPDGVSPRMQMFLWNKPGGKPLIINSGSLAGSYIGFPASFGNELPIIPLTADLALMVDNNDGGSSTDIYDGCDTVINGEVLNGKIVVIRRGNCEFGAKILNAEKQGAVAVIMVNNVATDPISMGVGAVGDMVTIPSIMVSQADGEAIIAAISSETINASLVLPDRLDGDFDNGIIIHEYGHGISNRLTGGARNVDCLDNNEQMGEGWSDWFALMLTMKISDVSTIGRGIGTFISSEGIDGLGIRPRRYSTDFNINEFTYGATNDDTLLGNDSEGNPVLWNEIVHNIGFVWATTLWDLTWAYIEKYGFDPNFYTGNGGNNKVMQLVIDGLKLQPCSPGFVDGRDALLAADMALTGGEDQCMIWEVFAARGLGIGASQGDAVSMVDQIESFDMPNSGDISLANCTTLSSKRFNSKDYRIFPNPTNKELIIKSSKNLGNVIINLIDINGRTVLYKKTVLFDEVELNIGTLESGLYILKINGEFINTNEKIIKN